MPDPVPSILVVGSTMIDLIAASFACDVTRVATLQLGYAGGKWMFDWEAIGRDAHQDLAHRDHKDEGSEPEITELLVRVHRWYATQVGALAQKLDAIPEGDGTVLDNTLIVWTSELGRGDHDMNNVPLVLLGGGTAPSVAAVLGVGAGLSALLGWWSLRSPQTTAGSASTDVGGVVAV